jgi:GntR family transcriptional repressor for pyruvate dehydrogenase complex
MYLPGGAMEKAGAFFLGIPAEEIRLNKLTDEKSAHFYMQVIEKIRSWILSGYIKEGEFLPSERDLAAMFDVSRMPVAQALKILEFLGVVHFIRGKGFCVRKIDIHHIIKCIGFMVLSPANGHTDVLETRRAIETQSVRLAAQRHTVEDIVEAEVAISEMEYKIARGDDVNEVSMRFHSALVTASHNEILIKINDFMFELLKLTRRITLRDRSRQIQSLAQHKEILEAVKNRNSELAGELMLAHLQGVHTP